jgi:mannose-6-phosphate isomerase-like protein (cupin superfamily)
MKKYTIHEDDIKAKELPGRSHKMVISPDTMPIKTMCGGVGIFPGNSHAPSHVHKNEEEILYVIEGEGNMYFDGNLEPIKKGSFMFVPKGVKHSLEATTDTDLKVFYVFSPPVVQGSYDKKSD